MKFPEKKIILFDLDDTLAESKAAILPSMGEALTHLLQHAKVGVITGGKWEQCKKQVVDQLPEEATRHFHNLYIMPTCGTRLHSYSGNEWKEEYAETLSQEERRQITEALTESMQGMYDMSTLYGDIIEDRESQMTFSALGQRAPTHVKATFDPDQKIRHAIVKKLQPMLPDHEIRIGGSTSIDITKKGMDKGWGIKRLAKHLDLSLDEIGFVGDALFPGGNDYPAKEIGLHCIQVANPHETEAHIRGWSKRAER